MLVGCLLPLALITVVLLAFEEGLTVVVVVAKAAGNSSNEESWTGTDMEPAAAPNSSSLRSPWKIILCEVVRTEQDLWRLD